MQLRNIGKKRVQVKPLTIKEKKAILRFFDNTLEEKMEFKNTESEAVKANAKMLGLLTKLIWHVVKEFKYLEILCDHLIQEKDILLMKSLHSFHKTSFDQMYTRRFKLSGIRNQTHTVPQHRVLKMQLCQLIEFLDGKN